MLRNETERPEAVSQGTVKLAGVNQEVIEDMANLLLNDQTAYDEMAKAVNPYGDGFASERIADASLYTFGKSKKGLTILPTD